MRRWMWYALGGAGLLVLLSRRTIYISRGGVGTVLTPDFVNDSEVSAIVHGRGTQVETIPSSLEDWTI